MNRILNLLLLFLIVSCTQVEATETPVIVNTKPSSTSILLPPTTSPPVDTPTVIPTVSPTVQTPEIICDPFSEDYCIIDGPLILQRPIQPPGNDLIDPVYGYGSTANETLEPHHGVEFSNPSGTPIHAAADGTVIFAGPDQRPIYTPWGNFYGNLVVIEHRDNLFTLYAHLSKIDLSVNQKVFAGDKVGEVGRTGSAGGSHLHFEVRRGDVEDYFATQNPELWLIPAKDENGNPFGALSISLVDGDGRLIEKANFTIGYYSDPSQPPVKVYYATPYSRDLLTGEENAALGALDAGRYRIVVEMNGQILERWVDVQSGSLTQVAFVVK